MERFILAWIPMVLIAIANGMIREATYGKQLSDLRAHQFSTLTGVFLFGVYIWGLTHVLSITSTGQAVAIGLIWLAMTITFEFLFGHYVAKHSWNTLLADYNVLKGRLWAVVLIWVAIAPLVFYNLGTP